jgi:fructokinase
VLDVAARADCVCFGTLAQRGEASRQTIRAVLGRTRPDAVRVFDINLRQHYFDREVVNESLRAATVLKINDEELPRLTELLGTGGSLFEHYPKLSLIALTRGGRGSELRTRQGAVFEHPGFRADPMVDAVGAGDSFTAALAVGLLRGWPLARVNDAANRLAAYVCTRAGATPVIPKELLAAMA